MLQRWSIDSPFEPKRLGDGGYDQCRIAEGSQGNKKHSVGEAARQLRCHLHTQAGFAHTARACQREQAHILPA